MARNQEKAQSMLYRFRAAQSAELGLSLRSGSERRPRLASSVSSLRECERWRGEVLREISRKVSKIQDCESSPCLSSVVCSFFPQRMVGRRRCAFCSHIPSPPLPNPALSECKVGLTDYEVRDLNDEINKLLREKHHWETQIVALGGANYKRAAKLTDDSGKEVPGMRGYK